MIITILVTTALALIFDFGLLGCVITAFIVQGALLSMSRGNIEP